MRLVYSYLRFLSGKIKNKIMEKIGIWGFGIVAKAAIPYFLARGAQIQVIDQRQLNESEITFLKQHNVAHFDQSNLASFLETHDKILVSCGVDLRHYKAYAHKWLSELDLFYQECKTPLIAITGSVGKTTITSLLAELLTQLGKKICMAGNVGVGLLDVIEQANQSDLVILEVSSFQLERASFFAPTFSICTNIYENHIDRHGSFELYKAAKYKIFAHLDKTKKMLIPFDLYSEFKNNDAIFSFFSKQMPSADELISLHPAHKLYFLHNAKIYLHYQTKSIEIAHIPSNLITYPENILIIYAIAHQLEISCDQINRHLNQLHIPDHRLQRIATWNGIDFYDDSKSTIGQSTLAAIDKIKDRPIILLLGGVSKGIDRSPFIAQLKNKVKFVSCFGAEAALLAQFCNKYNIACTASSTLDEAFQKAVCYSQSSDQILLSPAGASFDLFADYKQRGKYFQKLVKQLID